LRPNAGIAGQNDRKLQILAREVLIIGLRRGISLDHLVFEYLKFRQQYRSLKCVQSAIHTNADVVIATLLAMSRDLAQDHGKVIIVSEYRTAVTITAKRLGREEAGTSYFGQRTGSSAVLGRAKALSCVLDDRKSMPFRESVDLGHLSALSVKGYRYDHFRMLCNPVLYIICVDKAGVRIDIGEYWRRAKDSNSLSRSDVAERRCDYFIARSDIQRHKRN
jgi:hypothetical protein